MDYEFLLNKQKQKKKENKYNDKMKIILNVINSIDDEKISEKDSVIVSFKEFIYCYNKLKKNLCIENEKHMFISSIIDEIIMKSLHEIDLISKNTNNNNLKIITNCIIQDKSKKTINIIKK